MFNPKMVKFIKYLVLNVFSVCLFCGQLVATESSAEMQGSNEQAAPNKHLLLIVVPGLSFEEIESFIAPLPLSMQDHLQLAGMSMRTGAGVSLNLNHNIITLSTGYREVGVRDWNGYHLTEKIDGVLAEDLFREWSGQSPQAPIVHPAIFRLQEEWRLKVEWK